MVDWETIRGLQSLTLELMGGLCVDPYRGSEDAEEYFMRNAELITMSAIGPTLYREWYGFDRLRLTYQPSIGADGEQEDTP